MKVKCCKDLYMNTGEKAFIKNKIYEVIDKDLSEATNIIDDIDALNHYLGDWCIYFSKVEDKEIIRHTNRCISCGRFIENKKIFCKDCKEKRKFKKLSWYKELPNKNYDLFNSFCDKGCNERREKI